MKPRQEEERQPAAWDEALKTFNHGSKDVPEDRKDLKDWWEAQIKNSNQELLSWKISDAKNRRDFILKLQRNIDESAKYKIDTLCDIIVSDLGVMIDHLQSNKETIAAEIEESVSGLEKSLGNRLKLWNQWKQTTGSQSNEPNLMNEDNTDPNKIISVWQMGFMGPLIRKEKIKDPKTGQEHDREMAADHLMLVLTKDQREKICSELEKLNFEGIHLDVVSQDHSLYRLYFQEDQDLKWLGTMTKLQTDIQEKKLADDCYPDYVVKVDGNSTSKQEVSEESWPFEEPWPFYKKKTGLNIPDRLFNSDNNALLCAPSSPIKIAVIDSGIYPYHSALVDQILTTTDSQGRVVSWGYNAPEESKANKYKIYHYEKDIRLTEEQIDIYNTEISKINDNIKNCKNPLQNQDNQAILQSQEKLLSKLNDTLLEQKKVLDDYQKKT